MTAKLDRFALELDTLLGLHPGPAPAPEADSQAKAANTFTVVIREANRSQRAHYPSRFDAGCCWRWQLP